MKAALQTPALSPTLRDAVFCGAVIDSRVAAPGMLFVALPGEKTDGHRFVADALTRGAVAALVREDYPPAEPAVEGALLRVPDPLTALQELAAHHRRRMAIPLVGVTGSSGKTTTKEMLATVLEDTYAVHRTEGNLNNQLGVPLTLLGLTPEHGAAVIEMGMNAPGEIDLLSRMSRPTVGVITNVGIAHLEGLGGLEDVLAAKLELVNHLSGPLFVNGENAALVDAARRIGIEVIRFGAENGSDVRAEDLSLTSGGSEFLVEGVPFRLQVAGRFNVLNALAALAVGRRLGVTLPEAADRLASFHGIAMRFRVVRLGEVVVIDDTYNANPLSVEAALAELSRSNDRKVAVLGDMLELGPRSSDWHRKVGQWARLYGVDLLVGVGRQMRHAVEAFGPGGTSMDDSVSAAREIGRIMRPGDRILVKGSRATKMERVVEGIQHAV